MTDKGFREWFAKTVIVYTKQKETPIFKNYLNVRIREEADIASNWKMRLYLAHGKGFWWECVRSGLWAFEWTMVGLMYLFVFSYFAAYHCYPESEMCWKVFGDPHIDELINGFRDALHFQCLVINRIIHSAPFVKDVVSKVCV